MTGGGKSLEAWCKEVGISRVTAWRWRRMEFNGEPMLKVEGNILGYLFILEEDDTRFWARVKAGEFATELSSTCANGEVSKGGPLLKISAKAKGRRR